MINDKSLYLGIDQGSSSSKALLLNAAGQLLWADSIEVGTAFGSDGVVEQDAEELLSSVQSLLACAQQFSRTAKIASMGLACQRSAVLAWKRTSLKSESAVLTWRDTRLKSALSALEPLSAAVHSKTGLPITVHYAAPKIAYLQKRFPSDDCLVGTLDTFLCQRLGGALSSDDSMASRTMLYDLNSGGWDAQLSAIFGVELNRLVPIVRTVWPRGHVAEIPLVVSIGDSQAACFGLNAGKALPVLTLGTVASLMVPTGEQPRLAPGFLSNIFYTTADQKRFQIEGTANCCGATIDLIVNRKKIVKSPTEIDALCEQALARDVENGALSYLPIGGTGSPQWLNGLPSVVSGWDGSDRAAFVRAAMENLGCFISELIFSFGALLPQTLDQILVTGGVSKSEFLLQFISDCTGLTLLRPEVDQGAAFGAALLAMPRLPNLSLSKARCFKPRNSLAQARLRLWREVKENVQRNKIESYLVIEGL